MKQLHGFTLAEVLITLGIIGIIAAITIPALVEKHQKQVFVTKIKYTYTIVSNALLSAKADYGDLSGWEWGNDTTLEGTEKFVNTYLSPYLNITEQGAADFGNYWYVKLKNGVTLTIGRDGCTNPEKCNPVSIGTVYIIGSLKGKKSYISDNNRDYSRDDFVLRFTKASKGLIFFYGGSGYVADTREKAMNHPTYGCNATIPKNKRYNCGQLIFLDGWQIKEDYPW